jgi:hypothetical protein
MTGGGGGWLKVVMSAHAGWVESGEDVERGSGLQARQVYDCT